MSKYFQHALSRYLISGLTASIVHLGLLYLLTEHGGLWYLASTSIAIVFAFFASFTLQKYWTFENSSHSKVTKQITAYLFIAIVAFALNAFLMYVFVSVFGLWYMASQIITLAILAVVSFILYGRFAFNTKSAQADTMKVLITTGLYPPDIGGPATYAKLLEVELPSRDIETEISSFGAVRRLPFGVRHFVYFFDCMVRGTHANIIFALDPVSVGAPSALTAIILGKKFVLKVVGDYAWEQWQQRIKNAEFRMQNTPDEFQKKRFDLVTEARRFVQKWVARRADKIIVPSEYLKKIVLQWGVQEEKITVIHNAFQTPKGQKSKEEVRKELSLVGTVLVSVGRLVPWKGFAEVIELMSRLLQVKADAKLYIIGDGPERENLEFRIKNSGLKDHVFLTGRLEQTEMLKYVRTADVFVLNTGYEGFSHVLLEVMAMETPIVTTNVGGNQELISDKQTGFLLEHGDTEALYDTLVQALHKEKSARVTQNALEQLKNFSKEKMLQKTIILLKKI